MILGVAITTRHIRAGAPHSACNCAAALALREALPGREIEVWGNVIVVDGVDIAPPPELVTWLDEYDELKNVAPIAFEIDVPEARA